MMPSLISGGRNRLAGAATRLFLGLIFASACRPAGASAVAPPVDFQSAASHSEEFRGIWVWSSTVTQQGAEKVAEQLARHRINRVFFLVKGLSGEVCYPSKIAPALPGDKDTLKEFLEACHKRKIELHAWFVFNADSYWGRLHPEDAMCHAGKPEAWEKGPYSKKDDPEKIPICPLSAGYRGYFDSLVKEVLDGYDVDGIHLDYIRYGHMCYCFCPRHQALAAKNGIHFEKVRQAVYDTFYAPEKKSDHYFQLYREGDQDIVRWVAMRQEEIDLAVKEIRDIVKHKKPSLALSAAFMPEGGEADDTFALCHYAQNYATAGGQLDYILPMTYSKNPLWTARITRNAEKKSHRPVYSGVWASDLPAKYGGNETKEPPAGENGTLSPSLGLEQNIQTLRQQGVKGFVLFQYGSISDRMWNLLP
jgi:uncharacterized lipoprotein YddW (UPF0748 family)